MGAVLRTRNGAVGPSIKRKKWRGDLRRTTRQNWRNARSRNLPYVLSIGRLLPRRVRAGVVWLDRPTAGSLSPGRFAIVCQPLSVSVGRPWSSVPSGRVICGRAWPRGCPPESSV